MSTLFNLFMSCSLCHWPNSNLSPSLSVSRNSCSLYTQLHFAVRLPKLQLWSIYVTSSLLQLPLEATRFRASFIRFHKSLKGLSATWCTLRLCLEAPQKKTVGNKNVKIKSTPFTDARNSHMYTSNIRFVKLQHTMILPSKKLQASYTTPANEGSRALCRT